MYEYLKFFLNGGMLGVIAWCMQLYIYQWLGGDSNFLYTLASALTYFPLVIVNFLIQRTLIFNRQGLFLRFVVANAFVMTLVSLLAPNCRVFIDLILGPPWGERGGFILAALLGSIPSFIIKRNWVFAKSFN